MTSKITKTVGGHYEVNATGSILAPAPEATTPAGDNAAPDAGTLPGSDMTPPDGRGEDEALSPADEDENR